MKHLKKLTLLFGVIIALTLTTVTPVTTSAPQETGTPTTEPGDSDGDLA